MFYSDSPKNTANSRQVRSSQSCVHPRLTHYLEKHFNSDWRQPLHVPTANTFKQLLLIAGTELAGKDLILDAGCGTGESTRKIAARFPESIVFGVDRSNHRLQKTGVTEFPYKDKNILWVQAELETFWRLALQEGWILKRHYLLYPNPYPKGTHLQRRWHAHPVFPSLLKLGGILELRTNWELYAEEFAQSVTFATGKTILVEDLHPEQPLTAFERKYAASGHNLYRVEVSAEITKEWQRSRTTEFVIPA